MSSMKGGFSTLNRWFGRKKDKAGVASNGKLSKSTTQLHHMSTDQGLHINEASQLDYNRITPVPAATSNAPFEQTFRITVLLPKDQLYVTRLGARVPLSKLLSLVCDNKQLDADKYEFRNPVDASQVYSCESTIGAVGLSEIRLCHKSESYDSFNADSMLKFQRTAAARDSLSSSSDFSSSRHSQSKLTLTAKTPSPYSSTNSLNSMDSTGMNYTRTPVVVPPKTLTVAPPPRKKRVAPRPPSQLVIPEQSVAQYPPKTTIQPPEPAYAVIVKRPQLCMSTPNLASTPELYRESEQESESVHQLDCNGNSAKTPDATDSGHYATLEIKSLPEPTPRKRLIQIKKKTAPAPPPEGSVGSIGATASADTISLASTTASSITEATPVTPQPAPRITTPIPSVITSVEATVTAAPPLPSSAAPQLLTNGNANQNVSKVLLNRTPTPEPRSLSSANGEEEEEEYINDAASKQADSGIGEPLPSSTPSPEPQVELQLKKATTHIDPSSSEDDEEAIKVYNFKTSSQSSHKMRTVTTLAELRQLEVETGDGDGDGDEQASPSSLSGIAPMATTPSSASELTSLSSWNYAGAISPPPDFSDINKKSNNKSQVSSSPLDEIVDELSSIIQQQRLDTLIRPNATEQGQIESAKPNRLANFSIATIGNGHDSDTTTPSSSKTRSTSITRADSFQSQATSNRQSLTLRLRSSSQHSLNKIDQQRRSSSELSIAESPSLQSLELIKNILSNSRKNSLVAASSSSPDTSTSQSEPLHYQQQLEHKPKSIPSNQIEQTRQEIAAVSMPLATTVSISTAVSTSSVAATMPLARTVATVVSPAVITPAVSTTISNASDPTVESISVVTPTTSPLSSPTTRMPEAATAPVPPNKPLPTTYRYSGPPSINFATWSERPKSQVAIKNEGDYIYGGAKAAARSTTTPAKLTIDLASPILRMGIKRKDYHVPIMVKPLRDASQEREQKQEQMQKQEQKQEREQEKEPEWVKQQQQQQQQSEPEQKESQILREQLKPSTLPRPAKNNRFTLPASNSSIAFNSLERQPTTTTELMAPFGQNTLRRTGFKERMLAKEQEEKELALTKRITATVAIPTTTTTTTTTPAVALKPTIMRSSKLELKLQTETEMQIAPVLQVKLRSTVPNATPTPTPPAPPPMLTLNKSKPQIPNTNLTPTSPDTRSALLDAIRNFKRDELNRA